MRYATLVILLIFASFTPGCYLHSDAESWNGRMGANGKPVQLSTTTKIGLNFLVFLPFLGDMAINGLVHDITNHVKEKGGDNVRVFQAASENYWYGFPPFTWIVTPVISTVAADYELGATPKK